MGNLDVSENFVYVDVETCLLADLAASGLREGLAGLDPSSGNRPQALRWRACAAHDEDPAELVDYDRADAWDPYHSPILPCRGTRFDPCVTQVILAGQEMTLCVITWLVGGTGLTPREKGSLGGTGLPPRGARK
jgi:hypothetical protein